MGFFSSYLCGTLKHLTCAFHARAPWEMISSFISLAIVNFVYFLLFFF